jgi:hypothetical protein
VVILFRYIWIYFDILYSGIWFLTSGTRALSLANIVGKYFVFLQIFFSKKKKKKDAKFSEVLGIYIYEKIVEKCYIFEFPSEIHPI